MGLRLAAKMAINHQTLDEWTVLENWAVLRHSVFCLLSFPAGTAKKAVRLILPSHLSPLLKHTRIAAQRIWSHERQATTLDVYRASLHMIA